jgi:hypothetical protein
MTNAKVISLVTHPLQVTHLCFAVDGILQETSASLGASVSPFDFTLFYDRLTSPGAASGILPGGIPTIPPDHSRPLYDAKKLQAYVAPFRLASLRAEPAKAALAQALSARQNAFYAKYGNAANIIAIIKQNYDVTLVGAKTSKPDRLAKLAKLAQQQATALEAAYKRDGRDDVVTKTHSVLLSETDSTGLSDTSGKRNEEIVGVTGDNVGSHQDLAPLPAGGDLLPNEGVYGGTSQSITFQEGSTGDHATSSGHAFERQSINNTDYGYRMPYVESQAQNERAQISLIDEGFAEYMSWQNLGNLDTVFANELLSIDNDVYQYQIAFANTILMSPIAGTVTVLYKYPADAVRAGEPVLRVENNTEVFLSASLVSRGRIAVGDSATIETTLFDTPGPAKTTITGEVVAVRGQRDDDRWDVIIKCANLDGAGAAILPPGYHFDYDDTTVTLS